MPSLHVPTSEEDSLSDSQWCEGLDGVGEGTQELKIRETLGPGGGVLVSASQPALLQESTPPRFGVFAHLRGVKLPLAMRCHCAQ